MDAFVSRKRRKISTSDEHEVNATISAQNNHEAEEQSTDEKLALLSSVFENTSQEMLLEALLTNDGSVERALDALLTRTSTGPSASPPRKTPNVLGIQSSLNFSRSPSKPDSDDPFTSTPKSVPRPLTKKGKTLYLYNPADIAAHTPCTILHNFLPSHLANDLLNELLPETSTFTSATFRLFDNIVKSPHTASFYVNSLADAQTQKSSYLYNGSTLSDVREILPVMRRVSTLVESAVNTEITKRRASYPGGVKLRYQSPNPWIPNAAFVNCYDGAAQSVGWHTDQLSYLGPHPTIGSLSLGVQREFRIRRIVPSPDLDGLDPDGAEARRLKSENADAQGQISLPLPHNSLLVMHGEMQEGWKHCVVPASTGGKGGGAGITPHSIAGNKRINITYRWYREEFAPKYIPDCGCGVPCVLKSVMRRRETLGRYVWMCQTQGRVNEEGSGEAGSDGVRKGDKAEEQKVETKLDDKKGCGYFEWAEFDDDGVPMWLSKARKKEEAANGTSGK
ncbi:hypothetical protein PMZ80_010833 [Knufia obscura]|uniref:Fe2OG dioxygenase domain-containing protein n=1 Tax=Knufia obscura TaxID=1635080 RepID=A0ABR0R8D3_9EURO|nr:hypothetical protein PMZ80_010833 [Knufia obscura]